MENSPLKIRIPTEQYGFVEVDVTVNNLSEIKEKYAEVKDLFAPKSGLEDKDWREALDSYLSGNSMNAETYYAMSDVQQKIIQELKKAFKRLNKEQNED